jgi:putative transposase
MARLARVIVPGIPHHVTQRGNARRCILSGDRDRTIYLDLLRQAIELHSIELMGYCLMSNHVHLIAVPSENAGLGLAMKEAHGRFASYWNASNCSTGHVWQGRYYSCPLDERHLWQALRYTELNPVRASMVAKADDWVWSSASAHCGDVDANAWLSMDRWRGRWNSVTWRHFLAAGESCEAVEAIRRNTHTGRPLGTEEFLREVEGQTKRQLIPQKPGPKRRPEKWGAANLFTQ